MERFDVVVAGAGPAGSAAAERAASLGLSTLVLEERATIGHPIQCAGLLSTGAFAECRVSDRSVRNRVRGARVVSDLGGELLFDAGETKAVVVDRGELDREMAAAAANAGAVIRPKCPVRRVDGDRVTTGGPGAGEVGFGVLIAADGPKGTVARSLGMARAPTHLAGVQADVIVDSPVETRYVEIHPNAAPEFFAWRIPVSDRVVRVGLCGETGVPALFRAYLSRWPGQVVYRAAGTIPLGTMPRTYGRQTLFVGDAAGLAKPTSGGGVFTGVRSGRYAAETAAACLEAGDVSDEALAAYEARWRADFGRELALGYRLQLARRKVAPAEIDRLLRAFGNPKVIRTIVEHGDMDRPSGLLARLGRMPALWPVLPIIMRLGIAEILAQDGRA